MVQAKRLAPSDEFRLAETRESLEASRVRVRELGYAAGAALDARLARARSSYGDFVEFVLKDASGVSLKQAVIHRIWQTHVEHCWKVGLIPGILAPFAHGKTTQITIGRIAFELAKDTNLRVKVVCQNDAKAMERTMGISALVSSPAYRAVFPHVREVPKEAARKRRQIARWTQHEIFLQRSGFAIDPSVQAAGVLTAGTGGRADLLVFDDVVDQRNAIDEPALRQKVVDNVDNVWMQRLESWGRALFVATPWHQADLTHEILKRPAWCVLRQWISEDFKRIEQEVYNADASYPIPRSSRQTTVLETERIESSNIHGIGYDPIQQVMEVAFRDGARYRYFDVPRDTYQSFSAAASKGAFFHQVIRGKFAFRKAEPVNGAS